MWSIKITCHLDSDSISTKILTLFIGSRSTSKEVLFFVSSREPAVHYIFFASHPNQRGCNPEHSREINCFSEAKKDAVPIRAREIRYNQHESQPKTDNSQPTTDNCPTSTKNS